MARIGLLVPSSNTTVEPEFYRALPKNVTLHVARLFLTQLGEDVIVLGAERGLAMADDVKGAH